MVMELIHWVVVTVCLFGVKQSNIENTNRHCTIKSKGCFIKAYFRCI